MRRSGLQERIRIVPGGQTVEEGTAAARLLLDDGPLPTAIVAYDDDCAAGLWEALPRAGISVPGDISIVGYDDSRQSRLALTSLTTIGQDARRLASLAVDRVVARLSGDEGADRELVLSPHLVVRASTAPPDPYQRRARLVRS